MLWMTLTRYYENMSDVEFIDEAKNYWDDGYDDVVEEDQRVHRLRFQKTR